MLRHRHVRSSRFISDPPLPLLANYYCAAPAGYNTTDAHGGAVSKNSSLLQPLQPSEPIDGKPVSTTTGEAPTAATDIGTLGRGAANDPLFEQTNPTVDNSNVGTSAETESDTAVAKQRVVGIPLCPLFIDNLRYVRVEWGVRSSLFQ